MLALKSFNVHRHRDTLVELLNREEISQALPLPFPFLQDDAERYLRQFEKKQMQNYLLTLELEGKPIGFVGYGMANYKHIAQCYYWIAPELHGRGYGKQMIDLLCRRIFSETEFERIQALVEPHNSASARILEANDFMREGMLRSYFYHYAKDEYIDVDIYSRIRGE